MVGRGQIGIGRTALLVLLALWAAGCTGTHKEAKTKPLVKDATYSMQLAKSLYAGGRVSEALAELESAIEREPDNASLQLAYGSYCFRAARHTEAIAAFKRALAIDPYMTDAHNTLGAVYIELKDYTAAERELNAVLADPAYPTPQYAHFNFAMLYSEQGRDDEAITSLRRAVGIDPQYYVGHFQLASLLDKVGKLIEAVSEYEVAEPAYRKDGEYWYRLGFAYYRVGDVDKARDALSRVRTIAPGSESAARADEILRLLE